MLTFGSLQRDLSRVSRVPSPRPWSRRGSVCPSAKPGTVAPRDATGCHGQKPEDLGFSGVFWGIRWISGTMGQNVTFSAMICHDFMYDMHDLYMTKGPKRFLMVSVWLLCHKISQVAIHILPVIWMVSAWNFHEPFWNKQMLSGLFLKAKCMDNMGLVITHCVSYVSYCCLAMFGMFIVETCWNMLKSAGWPGSFGKGSWALLQSGRTCGGNHQTWENTESFDA